MKQIPDHISYSQVQMGRCLHAYDKIYLGEEYEDDRSALTYGKLVHETIFEYTRECIERNIEADFELMDELIDRKFKESGLEQGYYPEFRNNLIRYGEKGFRHDRILDFERKFREEIGTDEQGKPVILEGVIDRIDVYDNFGTAVVEIIDYKNQQNIESQTDIYDDQQLWVYTMVAMMHLYKGKFFALRKGKYFTRYNYLVYDRDQPYDVNEVVSQFDTMEKWLIQAHNRIRYEKDRSPTKCAQCHAHTGCPILKAGECPAWDPEKAEDMIGDDVEAVVRRARLLKFQLKEEVDRLKELVLRSDEPMEVDDEELGWYKRDSYKYKAEEVINELDNAHVDCGSLTLSKADVDKLVKKAQKTADHDLEELIASFRIPTMSTVFKY